MYDVDTLLPSTQCFPSSKAHNAEKGRHTLHLLYNWAANDVFAAGTVRAFGAENVRQRPKPCQL